MPSASWIRRLVAAGSATRGARVRQAIRACAVATALAVPAYFAEQLVAFISPTPFPSIKCGFSEIKNDLQERLSFASRPQYDTQFTILLPRLARDVDGTFTEDLSFALGNLPGIVVIPLCDVIEIEIMNRPTTVSLEEAHKAARGLLDEQQRGDILIWGKVDQKGESLTLYITGRLKEGYRYGSTYEFDRGRPEKKFYEVIAAQLVAESISAAEQVAPRGKIGTDLLRPLAAKIRAVIYPTGLEERPSSAQAWKDQLSPDEVVGLKLTLGRSETIIGGQGGENQSLDAAVEELEDTLRAIEAKQGRRSEKEPTWRMAQAHLAYALIRKGERHRDRGGLERAISLSTEALEVMDRDEDAALWTETQQNLGRALMLLGQLDADTERLEVAVEVLDQAAGGPTGQVNNLEKGESLAFRGIALLRLGERSGNTDLLRDAIGILEEAARLRAQEEVPLGWTTTQSWLGVALARLGERQGDAAMLRRAVDTIRGSLAISSYSSKAQASRDRTNLGLALILLGEREAGVFEFREAETLLREALEVRTSAYSGMACAETQTYLARALTNIGVSVRGEGEDALREADTMLRESSCLRDRKEAPLLWAETVTERGRALAELGILLCDRRMMEEAVTLLSQALEERTKDRAPFYWTETGIELARTELVLAESRHDPSLRNQAADRINDISAMLLAIDAPALASRVTSLSGADARERANRLQESRHGCRTPH